MTPPKSDTDKAAPDSWARSLDSLGPKGQRTRARILDAALELFGRTGSNSVSLRSIAAEAGLSHPAVLRYFPNKDALVLAAIERRDANQLGGLHLADIRDDGHGRTIFVGLVELLRMNLASPGIVATYVKLSAEATSPDHPAHAFFVARYRRVIDMATEAFTKAFDQHPPPTPITAGRAAQQLIALMDGLQVQWLLDPGATAFIEDIREFMHGLGIELSD